jgi:hypothetical protein
MAQNVRSRNLSRKLRSHYPTLVEMYYARVPWVQMYAWLLEREGAVCTLSAMRHRVCLYVTASGLPERPRDPTVAVTSKGTPPLSFKDGDTAAKDRGSPRQGAWL